jgi:putative ABC transport system permease protein
MPDWKQVIRERILGVKLDGARESEIVDELAQHLEDRYDALRSAGAPETEARRQALEELNGGEMLAEELRKLRPEKKSRNTQRQKSFSCCTYESSAPDWPQA